MNLKTSLMKNKQRVLVISRDPLLRDNFVTLLSCYGYYIDYTSSRIDAVRKFLAFRQSIIVIDAPSLPRNPLKLFEFFKFVNKDPIVLIAATTEQEERAFAYLRMGVYDIIKLPLNANNLHFVLRRAVDFHKTHTQNLFLADLLIILGFSVPLWSLLAYVLLG